MSPLFLATALTLDPLQLYRVEDPDYPGAESRSATAALLLEAPPPGVPHRIASIPEPDRWTATEALEVTNTDLWQHRGHTGAGVKVAVFDVGWAAGGYDLDELGAYETHDCHTHASCDLPIDLFNARFSFETGVHGLACAEVVRDLAPDAELHLVRTSSTVAFENAVDWSIREGIDVITLSMSFYNNSFYDGSGAFRRWTDRLEAHDILLVTSAGNNARKHWRGKFLDTDHDNLMEFDGEERLWTWLTPGGHTFYVNWDEHSTCGTTDLDVYLTDASGELIVGRSEDAQEKGADRCEPVERPRANVDEAAWYQLQIVRRSGIASDLDVDIIARGGDLDTPIAEWSVADPASQPHAFAVGAVWAGDYQRGAPEAFSSWGPATTGMAKPDIAGPDGLSTAAYGAEGFFGTSASSPAVAALVAVVMSSDPTLTPRDAARRLQGWALTDGLSGRSDPRWGAGKARLPTEPQDPGCGRRPLVLPLFLPPLLWWRRRQRGVPHR